MSLCSGRGWCLMMWENCEESENDHLTLIWAGRGAVREWENSPPTTSSSSSCCCSARYNHSNIAVRLSAPHWDWETWGWHSSCNWWLVVISVTNINLVSLKMSCLVAIGIVGPKRNISLGQGWASKIAWETSLSSPPRGEKEVRDAGLC